MGWRCRQDGRFVGSSGHLLSNLGSSRNCRYCHRRHGVGIQQCGGCGGWVRFDGRFDANHFRQFLPLCLQQKSRETGKIYAHVPKNATGQRQNADQNTDR